MVIRPTIEERKQFTELKKKIDDYEKSKTETIKMVEAMFKDVKEAILYDRDVIIDIIPIQAIGFSNSTLAYKSKIVITVGG